MAQYCDLVRLLRAVPLFAGLDPCRLKLIAFASGCLTLADGEALFYSGETADSVYIVEDGKANIFVGHGRNEVLLLTVGKHELVGELAAFRNQPRSATVRAAGPLAVLRIDYDVFLRIVSEDPDVALNVMRILSEKLVHMSEYVERGQSVRA